MFSLVGLVIGSYELRKSKVPHVQAERHNLIKTVSVKHPGKGKKSTWKPCQFQAFLLDYRYVKKVIEIFFFSRNGVPSEFCFVLKKEQCCII